MLLSPQNSGIRVTTASTQVSRFLSTSGNGAQSDTFRWKSVCLEGVANICPSIEPRHVQVTPAVFTNVQWSLIQLPKGKHHRREKKSPGHHWTVNWDPEANLFLSPMYKWGPSTLPHKDVALRIIHLSLFPPQVSSNDMSSCHEWPPGMCTKVYGPHSKTRDMGAPGWLSWLSICLWFRSWSQGPGIEPRVGLPAQQSLSLPFLSLALSQINKIFLKREEKKKYTLIRNYQLVIPILSLFKKRIIRIYFFQRFYLFDRVCMSWGEEAEAQGEAHSPRSREPNVELAQDLEIMTWAEGRCLLAWASQEPQFFPFKLRLLWVSTECF